MDELCREYCERPQRPGEPRDHPRARVPPQLPDLDAVRIYHGDDVTVEACRFSGVGDIAVVANHASVRGLVLCGSEIAASASTAM